MRNIFIGLVATVAVALPSTVHAQSAVTSSELDAAISAPVVSNRTIVQQWLATDRVANAAVRAGASATDLSAQVATLDDATLASLAQQAKADQRGLAGGDGTVLISTTAIIIGLLILILLLK
jgi:hypothetical protein